MTIRSTNLDRIDVYADGRPAMASPRLLLKKLIDDFDALGYISYNFV